MTAYPESFRDQFDTFDQLDLSPFLAIEHRRDGFETSIWAREPMPHATNVTVLTGSRDEALALVPPGLAFVDQLGNTELWA
jgi:hypothetical protein